jgi:2-iminobutanoate/2-iminopropanoate deaminase
MKKYTCLFAFLWLLSLAVYSQNDVVKFVNPKAAPPIGGFTNTVEVDLGNARMIFIAGQTAFDDKGKLVSPGNFEAQAEVIFQNLKAYIEELGGSMSDIVKLTNYLTNIDDLKAFIKIRNKYVNTKQPPAATTIEVSKLFAEGLVLEVEAVVVIKKR